MSDKPNYGKAVQNGQLRYLSVSQIVQFDPRQEGGCPRRWYFVKVLGKTEPTTEALQRGGQAAQILEHYLKTGEDTLSPMLRAGKHLLPRPGADLEVEHPLGNISEALRLRDQFLSTNDSSLIPLIQSTAGLTAGAVPLMGAADFRHYRNEFVDVDGSVRKEAAGHIVAEIGDHKTTSRIADHVSKTGTRYLGYAKTPEQVMAHPQMVGYGMHAIRRNPRLTHVRLSHIYYQTKNGYAASKRGGLLPVDEVELRWAKIESITREMADAARVSKVEDLEPNTSSCHSYGRPCPHASYCTRPERTVSQLFENRNSNDSGKNENVGGTTMSRGLFDLVAAPPPPPPPPLPANREALVAAERARLEAEDKGYGHCKRCGAKLDPGNASMLPSGTTKHIGCPSEEVKTPPPPPPLPFSQVNPFDSPPYDPIEAAKPLPKEVVEAIEDPEIRQRAAAHAEESAKRAAEAEAARKAAEPPKAKKTSGKCEAGSTMVEVTPKTKKVPCPSCGKEVAIRPATAQTKDGKLFAEIAGHLIPKPSEEASTVVEAAPVAPAPPPLPVPEAPPVLEAPPVQEPVLSIPQLPEARPSARQFLDKAIQQFFKLDVEWTGKTEHIALGALLAIATKIVESDE